MDDNLFLINNINVNNIFPNNVLLTGRQREYNNIIQHTIIINTKVIEFMLNNNYNNLNLDLKLNILKQHILQQFKINNIINFKKANIILLLDISEDYSDTEFKEYYFTYICNIIHKQLQSYLINNYYNIIKYNIYCMRNSFYVYYYNFDEEILKTYNEVLTYSYPN